MSQFLPWSCDISFVGNAVGNWILVVEVPYIAYFQRYLQNTLYHIRQCTFPRSVENRKGREWMWGPEYGHAIFISCLVQEIFVKYTSPYKAIYFPTVCWKTKWVENGCWNQNVDIELPYLFLFMRYLQIFSCALWISLIHFHMDKSD
jgi:hypothetical protein